MRVDILTLFPDTVSSVLHESIIGRAAAKGILEINCHQIRDFTDNRQCQVDDYPYGGGYGCVMMAQPLKSCLDSVMESAPGRKSRIIYMSPQGERFTQETAKRLARDYDHLVLVCGHYEGVDERFIEKCVDEEISVGDFVLTGGEIAAMAVTDSVCRLVPGVLADEECYTEESHWNGLLEYPQYTRPEEWEGMKVPDVLLNGNEAKIEQWRHLQQLRRTERKRPDMFEKLTLTDEEIRALGRNELKDTVCRKAVPEDIGRITEITDEARATLKKRGADQWQGSYPEPSDFLRDIEKGECYVLEECGNVEGFFTLSFETLENYENIRDGKWINDQPYCVLHRAAVSMKYRGSGLADRLISFAEKVTAEEYGVRYLRTDTHRKNKGMQRLLRENGFRYRGNIDVYCEPGHDTARQAYEKVLKKWQNQ